MFPAFVEPASDFSRLIFDKNLGLGGGLEDSVALFVAFHFLLFGHLPMPARRIRPRTVQGLARIILPTSQAV